VNLNTDGLTPYLVLQNKPQTYVVTARSVELDGGGIYGIYRIVSPVLAGHHLDNRNYLSLTKGGVLRAPPPSFPNRCIH
jgi:hypothetical protein